MSDFQVHCYPRPSKVMQTLLLELSSRVQQYDQYLPELYLEQTFRANAEYPHCIAHNSEGPIGWLKCFRFQPSVLSCCCVVDPHHRRLGIATALGNYLLTQYPNLIHNTAVFSCSPRHQQWVEQRIGAVANSTVTVMQCTKHIDHSVKRNPSTHCTIATQDEKTAERLIVLDQQCFEDSQLSLLQLQQQWQCGDVQMMVHTNGKLIAKAHLKFHKQVTKLSNLCTHPDYRNQGVASQLMVACRAYCRDHNRSRQLVVDVENDAGLVSFYQRCGFHTEVEHHLFSVSVSSICGRLI